MTALPRTAAEYVRSINDHDPDAFIALFADAAFVDDAGREFRGRASIQAWGDHDIFAPRVTLEVLDVAARGPATVLTTRVEGNFDRTGLPDPVIIEHSLTTVAGEIVGLTCRLAAEPPRT